MDAAPTVVHETHISIVFLVGDRAVKLKKPVHFDFLDLSTREERERSCHREVELNRRLAPDVYLGVADIFGPDGDLCDHLVLMRRMPDARRLSTLARTGSVGADDLRALAHVIVSFHSRAETSDAIDATGRADAVRRRWEAGFAEIAPFAGTIIDRETETEIERLVGRYLSGRADLFDARIAGGRVRDGHGDLLADDVFLLDDGPRVLDCLEFDDELRYGDVLADVAFLAMDLERIGHPDLAVRLLADYRELTADTYPATLVHHYIAFRAHIRAKVACLRAAQGDAQASADARSLLDLTADHLRRGRVALTLVGGPPGTGKSTLAEGIGDARGWAVIRSDEVRKDLVGIAHAARTDATFGEGIYADELTARTYTEMLARARVLLERGEPAVLDASWSQARFRRAAAELASATASDHVELRCTASLEVAVRRVEARSRSGHDPSDATPDVARELRRRAEPWPSAIAIDTEQSRHDALEAALDQIEVAPTPRS